MAMQGSLYKKAGIELRRLSGIRIVSSALSISCVTAHEEIVDNQPRFFRTRTSPARTPEIEPTPIIFKDSGANEVASDANESDAASEDSSDAEPYSSSSYLISKPDGEPGRPGRGGYNIEEVLEWQPKTFKKLKVRPVSYFSSCPVVEFTFQNLVHRLASSHIDQALSYSKQKPSLIRVVCDAVSRIVRIFLMCTQINYRLLPNFPNLPGTAIVGPLRTW